MAELKKPEDKESKKLEEDAVNMLDYERTFIVFDDGDIVKGTVVRIDRDEVLVDIGYKSEGVIPHDELCIRSNIRPETIVSIGDEIEALVLQKEDKDGRLILSKKRAEYEQAWQRIEEVSEGEGIIEGEVIEVVKGGLILDIGLRAFLPASLIEFHRVKELDRYLGQKLECKIIEMNKNRKNVVVSRRAVLEGKRREDRKEIIAKLEKGQILTGKISSLADFGAFVDLGELDGLVHISELSWNKISHPSEVVAIGDEVKVQVLDIDEERGRVSLGLRQTQEDPWQEAVSKHKVGEILEGTVERLAPFGAFVNIGEGMEGLVHVSELSDEHIGSPEAVLNVKDRVKVKIIDIDLDRRRISLSVKQAEPVKAGKAKAKEKEEVKPTKAKGRAAVEKEKEKVEAKPKEPAEVAVEKKAAEKAAEETIKEGAVEAEIKESVSKETAVAVEIAETEPEKTPADVAAAEVKAPPEILEPIGAAEEMAAEETTAEAPVSPEETKKVEAGFTEFRELKSSKELETSEEKVSAKEEIEGEPSTLEEILADMKSSRSRKTDETKEE